MASNNCGCGSGSVSVASAKTSGIQLSTHCLSSEYRIDYKGQATGDVDPIIQTTPDKILWEPLPNNSIYNGAPCLTDKTDETYRPISNLSEWIQWFEKYPAASYCAQTVAGCQWSYGGSSETIGEGLAGCLSMSTANYTVVYDSDTQVVIAGPIAYDLPCPDVNGLLENCIAAADPGSRPVQILGVDIEADTYNVVEDTGTINGLYRYSYTQTPQYVLEATLPQGTNNNRYNPASKGTRYDLRNIAFDRIQQSPDLISQFDTATGRLIGNTDDGVWVTISLSVFCSLKYTPTTSNSNGLNVNLGIAVYDKDGNATAEYRLDSDRLKMHIGNSQTVGLEGEFSYFLVGDGAALEPRVWIGGSFAGDVDLQIGSNQSHVSIQTEEATDYQTRVVI